MNTITMAQVKTLLNTGLTMVLGMTQAALIGGMVQTQDGMRKLIMVGMAVQMVQLVLAHRAVPDGYISTAMAAWLRLQDAKANNALSLAMNSGISGITTVEPNGITTTGPVSFGQFSLPERPGVGDMEVHTQGESARLLDSTFARNEVRDGGSYRDPQGLTIDQPIDSGTLPAPTARNRRATDRATTDPLIDPFLF